jgi:parvulin-like peptidyl-prolyl isomerase
MEMKNRLLFVPVLLALVVSLAACGGSSQSVPANSIAVVNGKPITRAQYNTFLAQALRHAATTSGTPKPGDPQYTEVRNQVIADLVEISEVEQQAPKEHVAVTQSDVTKFIAKLVTTSYSGSQQKLIDALKAQGLSLDDARQQVYINLLVNKLQTKVTAGAKVTEKQEQDYYNTNPTQFMTQAALKAAASKTLANTIVRKLQNGESFAKLAKQYSQDPGSAAQGGKFTATKGAEVPAYDDAAFKLKTGQLSGVVDATSAANGGYGYFIIKALGPVKKTGGQQTRDVEHILVAVKTTPKRQTFKEAQAGIHQTLLTQAQTDLFKQWLDDMIKSYKGKVSYQSGFEPPATTALPTTSGTPTTG